MIRAIFVKLTDRIFGKGKAKGRPETAAEPQTSLSPDKAARDRLPSEPVREKSKKSRNPEDARQNRDETAAGKGKKPRKPEGSLAEESPEWLPENFDIPPMEGKTRFHDLGLPAKLMRGIHELGFQYCTPIQADILPGTLEGRDATGKAQTGTGKSAAFLLAIYTRLMKNPRDNRRPGVPRALILAPTRELALQIEQDAKDLGKYTPMKIAAIFGGMGYEHQKRILAEKVIDIVVATPGRLLDFKKQGLIRLYKVEILVIDEADRMLDMGFIPDVKQIVYETPRKEQRQTLFFSATLSDDVMRLSRQWTLDPVNVEIEPDVIATENVDRKNYIVTADQKFALLWNIITRQNLERVMVFTNRKSEARTLSERLQRYNISCSMITGDVPQNKRIRALDNFKKGAFRVLVATDVAARGIHIDGISHVVNYNLSHDPEQFVHRIGRTGRAGASGISISFADEDDSFYIPAIEEYIGEPFECHYPEDADLELPPPPPKKTAPRREPEAEGREPSARPPRKRRPRPRKPATSGEKGPSSPKPAEATKAEPSDNTGAPAPKKRRRRRRKPAGSRPEGSLSEGRNARGPENTE
ncbi:ATP-dependent RNA helicase RhlB [Desulfobotulus alkaliphilus]|uniref:ATP-dependent RNA helicase RhlB n=1 Tax=Desulfobotulus alkaliphilus TaxID=622671 RepID=A0A562S458_9BACT|nr:DEAD/DEAH box helicase [Desulfobotulus alkaliphilus]TWI75350.1 ATP-dependent RNA helicase RhlB [Desulfobotulus alkaliphilus]